MPTEDRGRTPADETSLASWLDHVVSVPVVGLQRQQDFLTGHEQLTALREIFPSWGSIALSSGSPGSLTVERADGFTHELTPDNLITKFNYRVQLDQGPRNASPGLAFQSSIEATPYRRLLASAVDATIAIASVLANVRHLSIQRIGIVASARMHADALPPGATALRVFLGTPWSPNNCRHIQARILADIRHAERWIDRCHHQIDVNDDSLDDSTIALDWQRLFASPQPFHHTRTASQVTQCARDALAYFQTFATRSFPE